MKRVLIITYYWPPSGGAGVQRWLKFVKYLPKFDYQPIVYTHENGEFPSIDESLVKEVPKEAVVLKTKIWEPYNIYKKVSGTKERINSGFLTEEKNKSKVVQNISTWIRGNLFIPDARKYWIKPSVKYLSDYISNNQIDVIISTGPPHSMHLIALALKKKFDIPWIADFRDPWTNIDYYKDLKLSRMADNRHKRLEKSVLTKSDCVISVGSTLSEELLELGAIKVKTITNGYDSDDLIKGNVELDEKITIAHIGSFTKSRNPQLLLDVLDELRATHPTVFNRLELKLIGKVDYSISEEFARLKIDSLVRKIEYIPHEDVIVEQKKSHFLLLVVNDTPNAKGILTGKVFEYLAARRPIIAIAPKDGDLANLILETESGIVLDNSNKSDLRELLLKYVEDNTIVNKFTEGRIGQYSRESLTKDLVLLLDELTNKN
ncbi:MAG: glycosyltransferase family 4 protein [Flavobacteriales bacterium]|nr:glycosyltransferase family 4 protein [Flavobacteriales bacterium]